MTLPFALPDWLPWWVPLVLLLPALLYTLAFLFMPFSVIGVKSRLDVMEARLDEIQNEIRHLALRLPAGSSEMDFEETYAAHQFDRRTSEPPMGREPVMARPPIPPAVHDLHRNDDPYNDHPAPPSHTRPIRRGEAMPRVAARAEPRLDRQR